MVENKGVCGDEDESQLEMVRLLCIVLGFKCMPYSVVPYIAYPFLSWLFSLENILKNENVNEMHY